MEKLLKYENAKLKKQLIFTLPVTKDVCGRICPGCYALNSQRRFPAALAYRERRLHDSQQQDFVSRMVEEVIKFPKPVEAIRVHESGEFYSQEYVDKWYQIASMLPDTKFYAFTKRIRDFDFSKLKGLPNFSVVDSLHNGCLNYGTLESLKSAKSNSVICPATIKGTQTVCGVTCKHCWSKEAQEHGVLFVKH